MNYNHTLKVKAGDTLTFKIELPDEVTQPLLETRGSYTPSRPAVPPPAHWFKPTPKKKTFNKYIRWNGKKTRLLMKKVSESIGHKFFFTNHELTWVAEAMARYGFTFYFCGLGSAGGEYFITSQTKPQWLIKRGGY